MQEHPQSRTLWAERQVEEFLSLPLVSEFVFRSPQAVDGSQREVADFLVVHDAPGILISQKCQEDPTRTGEKLEAWVCKRAKKAVSQLTGALRTGATRPMWCQHPRRGRVDFPEGLPVIAHGVVLIEALERVALPQEAAEEFPLEFNGIPISYFSLNDFLNLTVQLRTVPEIVEYLEQRRTLPIADLRVIGEERSLFAFYLLNGGSFAGCLGIADAKIAVAAQATALERLVTEKLGRDRYSGLLEHVANELAKRLPSYAAGLSPEVLRAFDQPEQRRNYIEMQRVLADLRLRERAELGRAFENTALKLRNETQGFVYRAMRLDSQPEWVYVFGSSKNVERSVLLSRVAPLMQGALAHFDKSRCLLVIDRDRVGYEVALSRPGYQPSPTDHEAGMQLYGHLRTESRSFSLAP